MYQKTLSILPIELKIVLFGDGNFLVEAVEILILSNYSGAILMQIVSLCTLYFSDGKLLLGAVGNLILSNYFWTIGLQIVYLGTYGMYSNFFGPNQLEF